MFNIPSGTGILYYVKPVPCDPVNDSWSTKKIINAFVNLHKRKKKKKVSDSFSLLTVVLMVLLINFRSGQALSTKVNRPHTGLRCRGMSRKESVPYDGNRARVTFWWRGRCRDI